MKRLYVVEVIRKLVVVADDDANAAELAKKVDDDSEPDTIVSEFRYYPADWDGYCLPFGYRDPANPNRMISEWIEMGAAPGYDSYMDEEAATIKANEKRGCCKAKEK